MLTFGYFISTPYHLQAYPFIIFQVGSSPNIVTWSGNRFLCSLTVHLLLRLVSRLGLHLGWHLISHHVTHNHLRRLLPPEWLRPHIQQSSHRREQTHYSCHVKILSTPHDGFINMWPGGVTDMPGKSYAIPKPRIASRTLKRFGLSINNPSLKVSADTTRISAAEISP